MVTRTTVFCCLLLASGCLSMPFKCPFKEDLKPCSCYGYAIHCEEKGTTPQQLERALSSLRGRTFLTLHLKEIDLSDVTFNVFRELQFRELDISHSTLRNLTDTGEPEMDRLREYLEIIEITHSIQDEFKLNISSLRSLNRLILSNNDFPTVKKEWFVETPLSLRAITLYENDIESLEEGAFSEMTQLERLVLATNAITDIRKSMFPGPGNKLKMLQLDYNAISSIPEDFFTNMEGLTHLHLRFNRLVELPRRVWTTVWQTLKYLDLYGNRLQCDDGIEWMFHVRGPENLSAKCYLPKEYRGKNLHGLIEENREDRKRTRSRGNDS